MIFSVPFYRKREQKQDEKKKQEENTVHYLFHVLCDVE